MVIYVGLSTLTYLKRVDGSVQLLRWQQMC